MEKRRGRPKGPTKVKVVVSLLEPTYQWVAGKATAKKESPAAYLARNVEQLHENEVGKS